MDKKVKAKWVKALRSGRYKQTVNQLYDGTAYCCLGVLCRVVRAKYRNNEFSWKGSTANNYILPSPLRKELKITKRQESRLVQLNDVKQKSFNEIANWITKYL